MTDREHHCGTDLLRAMDAPAAMYDLGCPNYDPLSPEKVTPKEKPVAECFCHLCKEPLPTECYPGEPGRVYVKPCAACAERRINAAVVDAVKKVTETCEEREDRESAARAEGKEEGVEEGYRRGYAIAFSRAGQLLAEAGIKQGAHRT